MAATSADAEGSGTAADAAPGATATPELVAGLAMAPKAAKAAPRGGMPDAAAEGETDPTKPAPEAGTGQPVALLPPPPPPTHAASSPKADANAGMEQEGGARTRGLAKPEPLLAAAAAEQRVARPARAGEPAPLTEAAAPAATPAREMAPPPPLAVPLAPPTESQALAPPRQAPSASPAHQVAPVVVAVALSQGNGSTLTVRLNPGELGQVEVRIERPADGSAAQVKVVAERPETLALLQRDAPELGRALQQAGIQQDSCRLSFSLGGGQDQAGQGNNQGTGTQGSGAGNQGPGNQGWGGRQARFVTEEIPPPRFATSLLDMSI
jgi:Meckel syndrome type 1 protein